MLDYRRVTHFPIACFNHLRGIEVIIGVSDTSLIFFRVLGFDHLGFKDFMVFINTMVTRYLAHSCVFLAFLATAYDTDSWRRGSMDQGHRTSKPFETY